MFTVPAVWNTKGGAVVKKWRIPPGSEGCSGVGRAYVRGRRFPGKRGQGGRLLLALVTLCNLILSLLLAARRRQEVIRAVKGENGETVQVLLETRKETKT